MGKHGPCCHCGVTSEFLFLHFVKLFSCLVLCCFLFGFSVFWAKEC